MVGTPIFQLDGHIGSLGRIWHKFFYTHSLCGGFGGGVGVDNSFWEDLWWGYQPLCSQFRRLFKVVAKKNLSILAILGSSSSSSQSLFFFFVITSMIWRLRTLKDLCLPSTCICLQPSQMRKLGLFPLKFVLNKILLYGLVQSINLCLFSLIKFLWKSKVSSKVKAFAQLMVHKKGKYQ